MRWWDNVLYDTCSLVSLHQANLVHPGLESHFRFIETIEEVLDRDRLDPAIAVFFRGRAKVIESPSPRSVNEKVVAYGLSKSLSNVDTALFATALRQGMKVLTGDLKLARTLEKQGLLSGNLTLVLKSLVLEDDLSEMACTNILIELAENGEFLIDPNLPQTWESLKDYRFP